jgi:hypothetical protein
MIPNKPIDKSGVDSSIDWEEIERTNQLKREMQELMPAVNLLRIRGHPDSLICLERNQRLRIMGYTDERIRALTEPQEDIWG